MKYDIANKFFKYLERVETYSKLHGQALNEKEINWDNVNRYQKAISIARKDLYDLAVENGGNNG